MLPKKNEPGLPLPGDPSRETFTLKRCYPHIPWPLSLPLPIPKQNGYVEQTSRGTDGAVRRDLLDQSFRLSDDNPPHHVSLCENC
jgi:hypothetical protein